MKCKVCGSSEVVFFKKFKPYLDKSWIFEIYECKKCFTRFAFREKNINYHEEIYSKENSPYIGQYAEAEKIKRILRKDRQACSKIMRNKSEIIEKLIKFLGNKNDKQISILEIGCSTGSVTAYLQSLGYENAFGIDISKTAIEFAKNTFGDFYGLKEKNKKYDVIFHVGLIGCVDGPIDFLKHYLTLLSPDGVMFFNAPNINSIIATNEIWVTSPPPDLFYIFNGDALAKILNKHGFNVSVSETFSPIDILRKHINSYKNIQNNVYPRLFISEIKRQRSSFIKRILKLFVFISAKLLIRAKILKYLPDDYGLLFVVKKKND